MSAQTQLSSIHTPIHNHDAAVAHLASERVGNRILLVDSQAHVLRVMKSTLERSGYDVETAMSADMALSMMRESQFDALIIDNGLEKLDGQQLIYMIEDQFRDRAPAMFLVADKNIDILQQWCLPFDRTECLRKPISISYIDSRLDELLGE